MLIDRIKLVLIWVIVGLCAWFGYLFLSGGALPGRGGTDWSEAAPPLLYNLIWLVLLITILVAYRPRFTELVKGVALWGGLGLVLVAGYAYKDELRLAGAPVLSALVPGYAVGGGDGSVVLNRSRDGHFRVNAEINGAPARLLVDTGASAVVLTPRTARAAGYDPETLRYTVPISTANGLAFAAPIQIDTLTVGDITVENVPAMVVEQGRLGTNLLGMSFLGRLSHYAFGGDRLTFRQ